MAAPAPIEAPPLGPPAVGLLPTVAGISGLLVNVDPMRDEFAVEPEGCNEANTGVFDPCDTSTTRTASRDNAAGEINVNAFEITVSDVCSTFGFEARDPQGRVERLMAAVESRRIEDELWTGTLSAAASFDNRFLADVTNVDIVTESGEVDAIQGLACLEQGLADCDVGGRGMIHATAATVTHWSRFGLVRRQGPLLLSPNDHYIVAGQGYPGTSPDGEIPASIGSTWAYATGLVQVRRGPLQILPTDDSEAVDRTNNTRTYRASRLAAAWWSGCCHLGARLDIAACGIGGS